MIRRTAVIAGALVGCGYQPGSFRFGMGMATSPGGQQVTVGCLDVRVARRPDYKESAVLEYRLGNRCNRSITVDLQRTVVVARLGDGREITVTPYDPEGELRPVLLGGRLAGGDAIAYPTPAPARQVCVDAASIVHARDAAWLCFVKPRSAADEAPEGEP